MSDFEKFLSTRNRNLAAMRSSAAAQRPTLRVENAIGDEAELYIYDVIDPWWGVSAEMVRQELAAITAPRIAVHINSQGGDVFEAVAIYNLLKSHPANVTTYNDALAASAASFIMLAGDHVVSAPHSQWMIHEAWGYAVGNADDMLKAAEFLTRQTEVIAGIYAERGEDAAHWLELMKAETWFTADEAVAAGLADEVGGTATKVENKFDLSIFRNAPREPSPRAEQHDHKGALAQESLRFERERARRHGVAA